MRIVKKAAVFAVLALLLAGCGAMVQEFQKFTTPQPTVVGASPQPVVQAQVDAYHGYKPRIAVARFTNKTGTHFEATYRGGISTMRDPLGDGMTDQFITVLTETNRFVVLGSKDDLADALGEQDYDPARFDARTLPAKGWLQAADLLIVGAVTGFERSQSSIGGGLGGVGGLWGNLIAAGIAAATSKDYVAINFRAYDARTRVVVFATEVNADARNLNAAMGGIFNPLLVGVGGSYRTPIDQATRACMVQAASLLWQRLEGGLLREFASRQTQSAGATAGESVAPATPSSSPTRPAVGAPVSSSVQPVAPAPTAPLAQPAVQTQPGPIRATPAVGAPLAGTVKVKVPSAILRDAPNGQRVASVAQGTALKKVAERKVAEHTWIQVEYNEQEVWIRGDLVE